MFELLSVILEAANASLLEAQSLSFFPGEYGDGSIAEPDITEVEITINPLNKLTLNDAPETQRRWVEVVTHQCGGWKMYLELYKSGRVEEALGPTTLEGYCNPGCQCSWCSAA